MFFMRAMAVSAAVLRLSSLSAALRLHRPPLPDSCCACRPLQAAETPRSELPLKAGMEQLPAILLDPQGQSLAALSMQVPPEGSEPGEEGRARDSRLAWEAEMGRGEVAAPEKALGGCSLATACVRWGGRSTRAGRAAGGGVEAPEGRHRLAEAAGVMRRGGPAAAVASMWGGEPVWGTMRMGAHTADGGASGRCSAAAACSSKGPNSCTADVAGCMAPVMAPGPGQAHRGRSAPCQCPG